MGLASSLVSVQRVRRARIAARIAARLRSDSDRKLTDDSDGRPDEPECPWWGWEEQLVKYILDQVPLARPRVRSVSVGVRPKPVTSPSRVPQRASAVSRGVSSESTCAACRAAGRWAWAALLAGWLAG